MRMQECTLWYRHPRRYHVELPYLYQRTCASPVNDNAYFGVWQEPEFYDSDVNFIFEDMEVMSDFELHQLCCKYKVCAADGSWSHVVWLMPVSALYWCPFTGQSVGHYHQNSAIMHLYLKKNKHRLFPRSPGNKEVQARRPNTVRQCKAPVPKHGPASDEREGICALKAVSVSLPEGNWIFCRLFHRERIQFPYPLQISTSIVINNRIQS